MTGSIVIARSWARRPALRPLALVGAVVMAAHGLVHLMGTALLWKAAEPGELTYDETVPDPGSGLAMIDGVLWVAAAAVFVTAAVLVAGSQRWRRVALAGVVLSAVVVGGPLLAGSEQGVAGVVTNGGFAGGVVFSWWRARRGAS